MVFATKWREDRYLYFRHAPPPSADDFFRDEDLPKEPFDGAPTFMRSVYYYWWAFAREHDRYVAIAREKGRNPTPLPAKFQTVRKSADFMPWWNATGRFLFCEKLERNVRVHQPDQLGRITDIREPAEKIIISIPAHGDLHRILGEVEQLIIRERPNIPAVASWSNAECQIAGKYVLSSLHRQLTLWKLRAERPKDQLHELSRLAGIGLTWNSDTNDQRAVQVSKYLKKAECVLEHIGMGLFPITNPSQTKAPISA
jgi:hypothetical protein